MIAALALLAAWPAAAAPAEGNIVAEVRGAIARRDFDAADRAVRAYRDGHRLDTETVEALSWLGRGCLAARLWDRADGYALETRALALELLKTRPLDAERRLPIALGASIEVRANVLAARGARAEAVGFLQEELKRWDRTSLPERIQKNINLLSLEGKAAPPLALTHSFGPRPVSLAALRGKAVLLFFWAHWCPDCKNQAPALARLLNTYGSRGLVLINPTRLYGYAAGGETVTPDREMVYIQAVWEKYYSELKGYAVSVDANNFRTYGASTTPTLVLIDRMGIVRLYHPGSLAESDLARIVEVALQSQGSR